MSDHMDAPIADAHPRCDIGDIFAFKGETGLCLVMSVNRLTDPGKTDELRLDPGAVYEFKFDLDGDASQSSPTGSWSQGRSSGSRLRCCALRVTRRVFTTPAARSWSPASPAAERRPKSIRAGTESGSMWARGRIRFSSISWGSTARSPTPSERRSVRTVCPIKAPRSTPSFQPTSPRS